jgi:hypothetical protein
MLNDLQALKTTLRLKQPMEAEYSRTFRENCKQQGDF